MAFISKLRLKLGFIPNTIEIEQKQADLISEYNDLLAFMQSEELKHYLELESFVNSDGFKQKKTEIKAQKFNQTDAFKKEIRYKALHKSPGIKLYNKVIDSKAFTVYEKLKGSSLVDEFNTLEAYVQSPEFLTEKKSKEFKGSEAQRKHERYKELKSNKDLKTYLSFVSSDKFQKYQQVAGSSELAEYNELKEYLQSDEFKEIKQYMALSPSKKFELSEEYEKQQEYLSLKNSEKIKWYYKIKDSTKFDEVKRWDLSFEDHFEEKKLDKDKWLTRYYYGDAVLNDSYSLRYDKHFVTDGNNISFEDDVCVIETREEKVEGKAWHPKFGFLPKTFDFTSGLINTGNSFRQQYGRIEAKIRVDDSAASHAFWLLGEKASPQINVCKYHNGKMKIGMFWGKLAKKEIRKKEVSVGGSKYAKDFFIYTLEWVPGKITWKINGLEALSMTDELIKDPVYLILSSGIINKKIDVTKLPGQMKIDWVRCYQEKV